VAEVFISYGRKDRELAARLVELGIDAWFDCEISSGESFGQVIRAELNEANVVLVCWSPQAIQSQWIDAEADYARGIGTCVPTFVAPCALMPPFNRIHTDDLSNWARSANNPTWLRLVDRISKLLGRDGVAAAAGAYALGDEKALYDFAQCFPEEPAAMRIWRAAEMRRRAEFIARLDEARTAVIARAARSAAQTTDLEARIEATVPAFGGWPANKKRGSSITSKLERLAIVSTTFLLRKESSGRTSPRHRAFWQLIPARSRTRPWATSRRSVPSRTLRPRTKGGASVHLHNRARRRSNPQCPS
jgi:hypothetical protein